jgi:hypothetical protein
LSRNPEREGPNSTELLRQYLLCKTNGSQIISIN